MKKIKHILVSVSFVFLFFSGMGQTYNMSNTPVTTCSGTFYDSGGSSLDYSSSEDFTKTFSPSVAGNMLQFVFNSWSCESATYDHLTIYDGPNTGSPLIGTYGGTTSPGTIVATTTGDLTFVWHSDGSVTYAGWDASISCIPPTPMTYVSSTTTQASTASVSPGDNNQEIICVEVVTSGTLTPLVTDFVRIRTNGSTDPVNDISNIDIYYTGTSNTFATTTLFGSSAPVPTGTNINIGGSQTLSEGTNYFWVVYDVQGTATFGNVLDAICAAIRIGGTARTPSTTNPAGNRPITNTHNLGSGNWNTCTGTIYDSGGSGGDYSISESIVETYCSDAGNCIEVFFSSFSTESGYDDLTIYDGPNTSSTAIGTYDGTSLAGQTITSSSGCLTFEFNSDGSVTYPGWEASISCVTCPVPTCSDGIQNQGETGIDCGGPCPACPAVIQPTACTNTTHVLPSLSSVVFYDDGGSGGDPCSDGAAGNFCNCNCFTTVTICGAPGEYIVANFREFAMFNTNSGFDWMVIYDNNTTSGTILFDNRAVGSVNGEPPLFTSTCTFTGSNNPLGDCNYTGTLSNLCSTGNCLTFQFWATSVVNRAGWDCLVNSVSVPCTLPVELTKFEYSCLDENTIKLEWATATETNNHYFTIERSTDAVNFEKVVDIDGNGNSNSETHYEYIDNIRNGQNYYYRLSQTDFDGKQETFDFLYVNCDNAETTVAPNPAIVGQPIQIYGEYDLIIIKDLLGRVVNAEIVNNQIFGLDRGVYIIEIDGRQTKIIVE